MGVCYIVGAGEFTPLPKIEECDLVIAADGGYDSLIKQNITPNLLVGDLDSILDAPSNVEILRFKCEKDETDMHLAYLEGAKRGYAEFSIYGGTGGRIDHTLANFSLLYYIAKNGHTAKIFGKDFEAQVIVNGNASLFSEELKYFSVFAFGGKASGVSIKNAAYELKSGDLSPDFPLGVSNRFCNTPATVSVKDGALLVIIQK